MAPTPTILAARGGAPIPLPGQVFSIILSLVATTVLSTFLTQRILAIKTWNRLPLVVWLVFAIYIDSYLFVFVTALMEHSVGVNDSLGMCEAAIILCLVCYVTTKFIYVFLVEKAHIIRGTKKPRLKSKLYLVNSFGMLGLYSIVVILNFIFRIVRLENGQCVIGMRSISMIPLISFDTVVNIYLTILFLIPLKNLYTYKNMPKTPANVRLRTVAFRTFCGAICTLMSSIINLSVLMALNGEPGWVCLMCCNSDILFSAIVIQWVTSKDNAGTISNTSSRDSGPLRERGTGPARLTTPSEFDSTLQSGSADTTLNSARRQSEFTYDTDDDALTDKAIPPASVVVTTTIEHESKPCEDELTTASAPAVPPAAAAAARHGSGMMPDTRFVASQTRITAGSHFLNPFDGNNSPSSCCKISCSK